MEAAIKDVNPIDDVISDESLQAVYTLLEDVRKSKAEIKRLEQERSTYILPYFSPKAEYEISRIDNLIELEKRYLTAQVHNAGKPARDEIQNQIDDLAEEYLSKGQELIDLIHEITVLSLVLQPTRSIKVHEVKNLNIVLPNGVEKFKHKGQKLNSGVGLPSLSPPNLFDDVFEDATRIRHRINEHFSEQLFGA